MNDDGKWPREYMLKWETPCSKREDKIHCTCWYDGKPCCACGEK